MSFPLEGGCDCREVRYRMQSAPLFVPNALIESERLAVRGAQPGLVDTPTKSGTASKRRRAFLPQLEAYQAALKRKHG